MDSGGVYPLLPRYLEQRFRRGPLGYGWHHPWQVGLLVEEDGTVVIHYGNGAQRVFQPDSRGRGFFASNGDGAKLEKDSGIYRLTQANGTRLAFTPGGALAQLTDRNGNTIDLQYTGDRLTRLLHANGKFLDLTYTGEGLIRNWRIRLVGR